MSTTTPTHSIVHKAPKEPSENQKRCKELEKEIKELKLKAEIERTEKELVKQYVKKLQTDYVKQHLNDGFTSKGRDTSGENYILEKSFSNPVIQRNAVNGAKTQGINARCKTATAAPGIPAEYMAELIVPKEICKAALVSYIAELEQKVAGKKGASREKIIPLLF